MTLTHVNPFSCFKIDENIPKKRTPPGCERASWMATTPLLIISSSVFKRNLTFSHDGGNRKLKQGNDHLFLSFRLEDRRARGSSHLSTNLTTDSKFRRYYFPAKIPALFSLKAKLQPSSTYKDLPNHSNWHDLLGLATSLYPVYVTAGALLAAARPAAFEWFVRRSPASYSITLGTIMLCMGLTLSLRDLLDVVVKHPVAVTLIAKGDVPLSVIMTVCSTLAAVFATPLLTSLLAGAYVPVDALGLAVTTLQVVVAPVLLGACMQSACPQVVSFIKPFLPLAAVLLSSLQASSVFSANVSLLGLSNQAFSSQLWIVVVAVSIVHAMGFLLGFLASKFAGFNESQSRAISIEVGMQNSSLGVVLASAHFGSALACVPPAISAVIMNIMGSGLAVFWGHFGMNSSVIEADA